MPLVVKDRVKETTSTTGTGTITLSGAVSGYQSFSVIGNGNTTFYTIVDSAVGAWEVGIGTYTSSGTTLSRTTILESSSGGTAINFAAGVKEVFCTYPAERSMYVDGTTITPATAATLPVVSGGTGAATLTANNVLLGNGTGALQAVAPGTTGNVLTSNGTTWTSAAGGGGSVVSYPQNIQSANYTLVLSDAGKQIFHPASDANQRVFTIPSNASVAFPIGTTVLFVAENGGQNIYVAINADTLVTTANVTGTKTVPPGNVLTCIKTTSTKWVCFLANDFRISQQQVAVGHISSPYVTAYPWSATGFGVKYANPATLPANFAYSSAFHPNGSALAIGHAVSPNVTVYPWSGAGFGTKYTDPATQPDGFGLSVAFNSAGTAIAVGHSSSPYISVYPWSSAGFGTKYSNPATLPTGNVSGVVFHPADSTIAMAHETTPYVTAYPWSGSGFGTKWSDPSTLPSGNGYSVAFNSTGTFLLVGHAGGSLVTAYNWSTSFGFGGTIAAPSPLPTAAAESLAFHPAANAVAMTQSPSPYVSAYAWSVGGFGARFTNPGTLPTGYGHDVAFNSEGTAIAVAHDTTPFVTAYAWSGSGFGTKFTNPGTLPLGGGMTVSFTTS